MKLKVSISDFNLGLKELSKKYKIFAPKRFAFRGTCSDTDNIRYDQVSSFEEMEWEEKSHFSAKEAFLPVNEVLFYFTEDETKIANIDDKDILVFLRSCDLHGVRSIDDIYLKNGHQVDLFYKRLRERVKFVLVGCKQSYRNCFCVSMGTNSCNSYDAAMNIGDGCLYLDLVDEDLQVFKGEAADFDIDKVSKKLFEVEVPEEVDNNLLRNHPMWDEYDTRCIGCGRCNFTCPTCTCYSMQDIYYKENGKVGERRRVWASCQVDGFCKIAGNHDFRIKQGERMRFKTLHKISDHKKRFGHNMCVGCGRCDDACPQYISFSEAITKVNQVVTKEADK